MHVANIPLNIMVDIIVRITIILCFSLSTHVTRQILILLLKSYTIHCKVPKLKCDAKYGLSPNSKPKTDIDIMMKNNNLVATS